MESHLSSLAAFSLLVPILAFEKGHCYEPYIQNGNFTTSDPTYNIGTIVEFTCDPGHSLEQGPAIIECINVRDPYWNDTEPLCRGECGHGPLPRAPRDSHPIPGEDLSSKLETQSQFVPQSFLRLSGCY